MYLFILETIGTQELILVGIVALIVFGPRKLPEMARKAGSMMRELRSVSNDFKSTWSEEVRVASEQEGNVIAPQPNSQNKVLPDNGSAQSVSAIDEKMMPQVREVSEEDFKKLVESKKKLAKETTDADKENWL